jgi:O-methyltransferase
MIRRILGLEPSGTGPTPEQAPSGLAALADDIARLAPDGHAALLLQHLRDGLAADAGEEARYRHAEALCTAIYPTFRFSEFGRIFLDDEEFIRYYRRFMDPDNWHSLDRKYSLEQLLGLTAHLDADLAECGTYRGASAFLMCRATRGTRRTVHLFDSFEGLSAPGDADGSYWHQGALSVPEDSLHESLSGFDNYRTYRGWIPERFDEVAGLRFGFVHIDVDLYQPTLDSLEFFYPRAVAGAVILMDDYGFRSCPGARRAADEFFSRRPERIVRLPTGQAFVQKLT